MFLINLNFKIKLSNTCDKKENSKSKNYLTNHKKRKYNDSFKFRRYSLNNDKIHNIKSNPNLLAISSIINNILSINEEKNNILLIIKHNFNAKKMKKLRIFFI